MQLTDPISESALDGESDDASEDIDDDAWDRLQEAERLVAADPGNYDAHVAVCPELMCLCNLIVICHFLCRA
jgi:hypothetical protein